jgi:hypothetical protein
MKYYIIFISLFLISCSSDNETTPNVIPDLDRITTTDASGNILKVIDFERNYNKSNRLSKIIENGTFIKTLNYDKNENRVNSISINDGTEIFYTYGNFFDDIIMSEQKINGLLSTTHYYTNDVSRLIKDIKYENNKLVCEINYSYTNTKDGYEIEISNNCLSENLIITHESTVNPLFFVYDWQLFGISGESLKNVHSIKNAKTNSLIEYTYEYNKWDYPIKQNKYIDGVLTNIKFFEYDIR